MEKVNNLEQIKKIERWLYQYKQCKARTECLKTQLETAYYLQGMAYDKDKLSQSYKFSSATENTVCKTEDIEAEINTIESHIKIIEKALDSLSSTKRTIIEMRYFNHERWIDIAYEANLCERSCKTLRDEALYEIQAIIFGARIMHDFCTKYAQQTLFSVIL